MSRSRRPCLPNQKLRLWVTANTCGNANTNLLLLLYVTDLTRCKGCFWEEWCRAESQETSGPGSSYQKMSGLGQTWRTAKKPGHDLIFNRNDESITRLEKKKKTTKTYCRVDETRQQSTKFYPLLTFVSSPLVTRLMEFADLLVSHFDTVYWECVCNLQITWIF